MQGAGSRGHTVNGEVTESSAGGALDLDVVALEEEHDGPEGVGPDSADLLLGDLGKGESSATLEVDIVAVGQSREGLEGLALKEVCLRAVLKVLQQVGHGVALIVEQQRLVGRVSRAPAAAEVAHGGSGGEARGPA